jgi:hypothetical protein
MNRFLYYEEFMGRNVYQHDLQSGLSKIYCQIDCERWQSN